MNRYGFYKLNYIKFIKLFFFEKSLFSIVYHCILKIYSLAFGCKIITVNSISFKFTISSTFTF